MFRLRLQNARRRDYLGRGFPGGDPSMSDRMTAMDVERQEFHSRVRGYDKEEVRMFLRAVAEEFGRLHLENGMLREEIGHLKLTVEDLRSRERALQDTLVT